MHRDQHNFYKLGKIVYNEVNEALRHVFKTLWDNTYTTIPWTDDEDSARNFRYKEELVNPRMSRKSRNNLDALINTHGDRAKWDLSLLMYALIFSKSLDLKENDNRLYTAIDSLRDVRNNKFAHVTSANCSDSQFRLIYNDVIKAIKVLPDCSRFKRNIIKIKNETVPPSHNTYIELTNKIANDRIRSKRMRTFTIAHLVCMFVVLICILSGLFMQGKPSRRWALPDPQDWFIGREREIQATVVAIINNGSRLNLYKGGTGFGKTSASYVVGQRLLKNHGFDVMFVSLRGTSDVQTAMGDIYYLATGKSDIKIGKLEFISFVKSFFDAKVLIILDSIDAVLSKTKEVNIMKTLLVDMMKHNNNVYLLCTSQVQFYLATHTVVTTTFLRLSTDESAEVLRKIYPDMHMAEAVELGNLCGGVPILLSLYGHLILSKTTFTASTVISQINKFGVLMAFDADDVPVKNNIIQMLQAFICMTNHAVVDAFLKLVAVYPDSFAIADAARVLELPIDATIVMIGKLEDFSIVTMHAYHPDGAIGRVSIDPLLQQYAPFLATNDLECIDDVVDVLGPWSWYFTAVLLVPVGIAIFYVVFRFLPDKRKSSTTFRYIHNNDGSFEITYTQNLADNRASAPSIESSYNQDPAFRLLCQSMMDNNRSDNRARTRGRSRRAIEA